MLFPGTHAPVRVCRDLFMTTWALCGKYCGITRQWQQKVEPHTGVGQARFTSWIQE